MVAPSVGLTYVAMTCASLMTTMPVPPTSTVQAIVEQFVEGTAKRLAARRGVQLKRPVRVAVVDEEKLLADVQAARAGSPAESRNRALLERQMGLRTGLGISLGPANAPEGGGAGEIGGLYDSRSGRVLLGAGADLRKSRLALVHDVAQAVLDQKFDLGRFLGDPRAQPGGVGGSDAAWARQATIDGDATVQAIEHLSPRGALPGAREVGETWDRARHSARADGTSATLQGAARVFVGLDGAAFIASLRWREPWSAVDAVWEQPPLSTEQVLHTEKYARHEPTILVGDRLPSTVAGGWRLAYGDTLGELGVRAFLERFVGEDRSDRAAAGWGGDRAVVYRATPNLAAAASDTSANGSDDDAMAAVAWILAWDTELDAEDFAVQAVQVMQHLAAAPRAPSSATTNPRGGRVIDSAGRVYAWQQKGALVGLLFGAPTTAEALLAELLSASAATQPAPEKRRERGAVPQRGGSGRTR